MGFFDFFKHQTIPSITFVICKNCNGAIMKEIVDTLKEINMWRYCPKCGVKINSDKESE